MTRGRSALLQAAAGAVLLMSLGAAAVLAPGAPPPPAEPLQAGFTFSQQQAAYLGVPYEQAYSALMRLSPAVVRLAAYWDQIEPEPGFYDFSTLDWLVANTPPTTKILLVVGMKAPRWPEYYIPAWLEQANDLPAGVQVSSNPQLREAVQQFLTAVVTHYRDSPAIAYWQVENEALDPSGPRKWTIGSSFLNQEVALVRGLDGEGRPVVLNTFFNTNPLLQIPGLDEPFWQRFHALESMADAVGLDVYPVREHPVLGQGLFFRWPAFLWQRDLRAALDQGQADGKQVWLTEVQAEPWLLTQVVYLAPSPSPEIQPSETGFVLRQAHADGFQRVLLWGAEYWYLRRDRYNDSRWWDEVQPFLG